MRTMNWIATSAVAAAFASAGCNSFPGLFGGTGTGGSNSGRSVLPDSLSLDLSELPDEDGAGSKTKHDADLPAVTPFERTLRAAARTVHSFHRLADRAVALAARVNSDITDPTQTQVTGSFFANGTTVSYKADFAAFDFDGDGVADGSGLANTAPVALRMWVDRGSGYERFLCALVTTRPTTVNFGAGRLYVKPGAARSDDPSDFQVYVDWDRTDETHKWNEAFISGQLRSDLRVNLGHARVDVRTDGDGTIEKTVRTANDFNASPFAFNMFQSAVHWAYGSQAALLSGLSSNGTSDVGFNNVCVDLAAQSLATHGECDDFDTQDMSFIDFAATGETDFPSAFPETPSF